jgi:hypothetical protein
VVEDHQVITGATVMHGPPAERDPASWYTVSAAERGPGELVHDLRSPGRSAAAGP